MRVGWFAKQLETLKDDWYNYRMPGKKNLCQIKTEADQLFSRTKPLKKKQPKCWKEENPSVYEEKFRKFEPYVENLKKLNSHIRRLTTPYTTAESTLSSLERTIEKVKSLVKESREMSLDVDPSQASELLNRLLTIEGDLRENFTIDDLRQIEAVKIKIRKNGEELLRLGTRTHKWKPIEWAEVITEPGRPSDPEGPLPILPKTLRYVSKEECERCQFKRSKE